MFAKTGSSQVCQCRLKSSCSKRACLSKRTLFANCLSNCCLDSATQAVLPVFGNTAKRPRKGIGSGLPPLFFQWLDDDRLGAFNQFIQANNRRLMQFFKSGHDVPDWLVGIFFLADHQNHHICQGNRPDDAFPICSWVYRIKIGCIPQDAMH